MMSLTDRQLGWVQGAAALLAPYERDRFLRSLANHVHHDNAGPPAMRDHIPQGNKIASITDICLTSKQVRTQAQCQRRRPAASVPRKRIRRRMTARSAAAGTAAGAAGASQAIGSFAARLAGRHWPSPRLPAPRPAASPSPSSCGISHSRQCLLGRADPRRECRRRHREGPEPAFSDRRVSLAL